MTNKQRIFQEDVMRDAIETSDADKRDKWNGHHSVESVNIAAHLLREITEPEYQRNRVALNKYAF